MGAPKNRSENRKARRDRNHSNHTPLLSLVESERRVRRPVKAAAREVKPLNDAQALYDAHIRASIITFGVGPAGTGKTWLAATRAAQALKAGEIERIIVTRPALEAGESLGFLPGEMDDKYQPYFRPVCDALAETLGSGPLEYHLKSGTIEARPLAYLRGATFKNCLVLFDEAQNATVSQMKLFLTRIGDHSRVVINGDPDQIDLPPRVGQRPDGCGSPSGVGQGRGGGYLRARRHRSVRNLPRNRGSVRSAFERALYSLARVTSAGTKRVGFVG